MSEFGYKINNYEAGSIYGVMMGMRDKYDYTEAMLTNSLLLISYLRTVCPSKKILHVTLSVLISTMEHVVWKMN